MEVSVHMLHEETRITPLSTQHAQDSRLRRLQWAVTACSIGLCALLALTLYQMFGSSIQKNFPVQGQVQRQYQVNSDINRNTDDKRPRAHLTGKQQSETDKDNNILQWESRLGLAFVKDGMQCDNNSIQIPKKGYYFVYAQVSLKTNYNPEKQFESSIIRINDNYPDHEKLFSGKTLKDAHQPIYFGGLLHLIKGDHLKVQVTFVNQVDITSNYKTFFGAFWVNG